MITMLIAGGASIGLALDDATLRIVTGLLLAIGCMTVLSIKTCPQTDARPREQTHADGA